LAARLDQRGVLAAPGASADLVLLCVPDAAIASVARQIAVGPWVAHISGATPIGHLDPHIKRFTLHPLQTFTHARGPEQLDGAWGALASEDPEARNVGRDLAALLGLRVFELADDRRALYHLGAVLVSNYLVTLHRAAVRAFAAAGAPPEALLPLIQRTIDNGFDLTGPLARGDGTTIHAHLEAIRRELPDLEDLYTALAGATKR
jgi:predicted short-subunit dehydrogenase-like oxidoreductase (DUF2520 family)